MHKSINSVIDLIDRADHIVALTGAGVSTDAGIPDFRSEGGLWDRYDPMEAFSLDGFRTNPTILYEVGESLLSALETAEPTAAHRFLAALEERGKLQAVVTQNIDGLHQRAGSKTVLEVHGTLQTYTALGSGRRYTFEEVRKLIRDKGIPPRCEDDNSLIKPDIVLFGEYLPEEVYRHATQYVSATDLLLVLGSSLVVSPVADLPGLALANGAQVAIFNLHQTAYDHRAAVTLPYRLGDVMNTLLENYI